MTTPASTHSNPPPSSGESARIPSAPETAPEPSTLHSPIDTIRDRIHDARAAARKYWVPPSLLTDPPPSWTELAAYAHHGAWTKRADGPVRWFGIGWHRSIGLPATTVARYTEWLLQRPGRALTALLLWELFIRTGPGPWIAAHLIRPALGLLAWALI